MYLTNNIYVKSWCRTEKLIKDGSIQIEFWRKRSIGRFKTESKTFTSTQKRVYSFVVAVVWWMIFEFCVFCIRNVKENRSKWKIEHVTCKKNVAAMFINRLKSRRNSIDFDKIKDELRIISKEKKLTEVTFLKVNRRISANDHFYVSVRVATFLLGEKNAIQYG